MLGGTTNSFAQAAALMRSADEAARLQGWENAGKTVKTWEDVWENDTISEAPGNDI